MMTRLIIALALAIVLSPAVSPSPPISSQDSCDHDKWIAKSLEEVRTVKAGMTRGDLLRVFDREGGLSTRTHERFFYRKCQYIHVDVEFEPAGSSGGAEPRWSADDKILKISPPYLDEMILD
jgi:hypothetical protein